jgi:hypothetical protein
MRGKSPENGNYKVGYNDNKEFKPSGLKQPAGKTTKKGRKKSPK